MFDTDYPLVCHRVMVRAKRNEIAKAVRAVVCKRRDMMDMDVNIKPAYCAPVPVADHRLFFDIFPLATLPIAVIRCALWIVCGQAEAIAIASFSHLARPPVQVAPAVRARCKYLASPAGSRCHSLPFSKTIWIATSDASLRSPRTERVQANGTHVVCFPASIVPVVCSSVLVSVDVIVLLALVFLVRDYFTATAAAVDYFRSAISGVFRHCGTPSLAAF